MPADTDIAIIGMSGCFPGAPDVPAFWRELCRGAEGISRFSREELLQAGEAPEVVDAPDYVPAAGIIEDGTAFDREFFGFSAREAAYTDPQHRLLLEHAFRALEHAGHGDRRDPQRVGVFASSSAVTYPPLLPGASGRDHLDDYVRAIGRERDFLSTRISYKLNLTGPSVNVQTACSSSLVAVHMAAQSLLGEECDMALAGGVSLHFPLRAGYRYEPGGIMSPDGHCRPFDEAARGTVRGSGAGVVVLRRLEVALEEGDHVWAVMKGSAVNNDGVAKVGYAAPSEAAQAEVVAEAQAVAGTPPDTIGFVEGHGTGTPLGDPIEVAALREAFAGVGWGTCLLGSSKANVGHLDAAAAMPGLIKAILAVRSGIVPPTPNFASPSPVLGLDESPFRVNTRPERWPRNGTAPRRAAVSSFGIGGTNAHAVLEQPAPAHPRSRGRRRRLLMLSARTDDAVAALGEALAEQLQGDEAPALEDVAFTLARGRTAFARRAAVAAETASEAASALRRVTAVEAGEAQAAFLFPGQGAQYPGMARSAAQDAGVREELDAAFALVSPCVDFDLERALLDEAYPAEELARTAVLQPALFAFELALANVWRRWEVEPAAMIGHSLGELTCACVAGVMTPDDAARVVAERGRLMERAPAGTMLAVLLDEAEITARLPDGLDLAAVNAPGSCVVSGSDAGVAAFAAALDAEGVATRPLRVSRAFHSALIEPVLDGLQTVLAEVRLRPPRVPFVSNVSGTWIEDAEATDPAYWVRQARSTVRFADGVAELARRDRVALLEVGPGRTLAQLAAAGAAGTPIVATLPRPDSRLEDAAGAVWTAGVQVVPPEPGRRVPLPTHPLDRRPTEAPAPAVGRARAGPKLSLPLWRPRDAPGEAPAAAPGAWAVLGPDTALREGVTQALRAAGREVADQPRLADRLVWCAGRSGPGPAPTLPFTALLEALRDLRVDARPAPVGVDVLTRGTCDVIGPDAVAPGGALAHAAAQVAAQEHPNLVQRALDLSPDEEGDDVAVAVRELLGAPPRGELLAWRESRWWRRELIAAEVPPGPVAGPLRRGGVYLITGGLGGVGSALASELVATREARVALLGRTASDDRPEVRALRERGAHVLALAADVTDAAQVAAAISRTLETFGRLDGVVHAAGAPAEGRPALSDPTPRRSLAAKVEGTLTLAAALDGIPIDFLCLCSSLAAMAGGPGEADYVAGNAFLSAFAAHRTALGRRTIAIEWDAWAEQGMAATAAAVAGGSLAEHVAGGLRTRDAVAAFTACLRLGLPRVAVAAGELRERLAAAEAVPAAPPRSRAEPAARAPAPRETGDGAAAIESALAAAWRDVLGVTSIAPGDDFFDLGGNSLLALRVAGALRDALGVQVPVDTLVAHPTFASLVRALDADAAPARADAAASWLLRLVCLPYAGARPAAFEPWRRAFAGRLDVDAIVYPGRDARDAERGARTMDDLVELLLPALLDDAARGRYALFGHSLGALVAFELARALRARGRAPDRLIVSACPAPQTQAARPTLHRLSDGDLVEELRRLGGVPAEVLDHPEFRELLLPPLRADLEVYGSYEYRTDEPLPFPITVLGGTEDDAARPDELAAWAEHTTAGCDQLWFPGGHFFVEERRDEVLEAVAAALGVASPADAVR